MTSINPLSSATPLGRVGSGMPDARGAATGAIGEIGQRVLAWVDAIGRGSGGATSPGAAAWAEASGTPAGFKPDARELARGGDVYGLDEIGRGITASMGGTPAEEGSLRRALDSFTREAVIQIAGLSGAPGDQQIAGVRDALTAAGDGHGGEGVEGVIARVDLATASLAAQNGR